LFLNTTKLLFGFIFNNAEHHYSRFISFSHLYFTLLLLYVNKKLAEIYEQIKNYDYLSEILEHK